MGANRILPGGMLAGALALATGVYGQESAPLYLLPPASSEISELVVPGVDARLTAETPTLPGLPVILRSGASWAPMERLALRAGISTSRPAPCPAPMEGDCQWMMAQPSGEQAGFSVGASWRPLRALSLSLDYASGPSSPELVALDGNRANVFGIKEDLALSCRLDTRAWGDLEFGLQLSRWQDDLAPVDAAQPDSAALGVSWELGAFRGDVTSRYMQMLGAESPASGWNTFDISFAWRTPWNASLSIGARNLLDEAAPAAGGIGDVQAEDFLGRVPYVRYQQDL